MNSIEITMNSNEATFPVPHFVVLEPLLLAGLREPLDENSAQNIPALWERFFPFIGKIPHQIGRVAFGVCIRVDSHKSDFYYMASCEVMEFANLPQALSPIILPSQRYAVFAHNAHVSRIKESLDVIFDKWLPQSGFRHAEHSPHFFERYGENFDASTGLGDMEIWLPILI